MSATERIHANPNVGLAAPALIRSQPTTSDLDIWCAAQATISRYGAGARLHTRADGCMDMDGRAVRHRIDCDRRVAADTIEDGGTRSNVTNELG